MAQTVQGSSQAANLAGASKVFSEVLNFLDDVSAPRSRVVQLVYPSDMTSTQRYGAHGDRWQLTTTD